MTAALLDEGEQGAVLRPQLRQRVPQRIELLGIDRARRLGNVFVFVPKWQKDAPELLPPELIDAGVTREPEEPRLELRRRLESVERADHFYEYLLRQVFDVIAPAGHGVNESGDPMLVTDDELSLGAFIALLSSADQIHQRGR